MSSRVPYAAGDLKLFDSEQSIYNFLDSLDLLKYYPLFSGYDTVDSLCVLSEADFVRIGVVNAKDRRTVLARLERDFGAPSPEVKSTLARGGSQASMTLPANLHPPKKKKGLLRGKFPLKATERPKSAAASAAHKETSRPSIDSTCSKSSTVSDVLQDPEALLQHQPWFHGKINRKIAEAAVRNDGDILVRESISQPGQYVLTAYWKGKSLHFVPNTVSALKYAKANLTRRRGSSKSSTDSAASSDFSGTWYRFGGEACPTLVDLVNHHLTSKQPISDPKGPIAIFAVPRHVTADDRSSLAGSNPVSRRHSLRLDDMDSLMFDDPPKRRSASFEALDSPGVDSIGNISLPNPPTNAASGNSPSPTLRKTMNFGIRLRGKSPLRQRKRPQSVTSECGTSSSLMTAGTRGRLSGSANSLQQATFVESAANPDLPDRDLVKAISGIVLQNGAVELARHIARTNLQLTHILLPKDVSLPDAPYTPLVGGATMSMSHQEMEVARQQQSSWEGGGATGLSNALLPQGSDFCKTLLRRFTSLSRWAAVVVIGAGDLMNRCTALRKLVDVAQCLQSDGIADLFGFQAVMAGLRSENVQRLSLTWSEFRENDSKVAMLYDSQLTGLDHSMRRGINTHSHTPVSIPPIQPLLELLASPAVFLEPDNLSAPPHSWFSNDDDDMLNSLAAVEFHMACGRQLAVQSHVHSHAAAERLAGTVCNPVLEAYFKRDFLAVLLTSRPGLPVDDADSEDLIVGMMAAMSLATETSQVFGRNTAI